MHTYYVCFSGDEGIELSLSEGSGIDIGSFGLCTTRMRLAVRKEVDMLDEAVGWSL